MPFIIESTPSSSGDGDFAHFDNDLAFDAQHIVSDSEYAGTAFSGNSEKPLGEQLEPIAVVGMGNEIFSSPYYFHVSSLTCG